MAGKMLPEQRATEIVNNESIYPLGSFSRFVVEELHVFNTASVDVTDLIRRGMQLLPSDDVIGGVVAHSEDRAALALGDLGMFASSLAVKGINLNEQLPALVRQLIVLGKCTGLPPRDTYYSFTELNPPGKDARTFVGTEDERRFIYYNGEFVREFRKAISAIRGLLGEERWGESIQRERAQTAAQSMEIIARLMLEVRGKVAPSYFIDTAIFASPFEVGDTIWIDKHGNPTTLIPKSQSADINISLTDALLYGIDADYALHLHNKIYPHLPNSKRALLQEIEFSQPDSLADRFLKEPTDEQTTAVKDELIKVYKGMWQWRSLHNSAVSTHIRSNNRGLRPDGTFSYDKMLLDFRERSKTFYRSFRVLERKE